LANACFEALQDDRIAAMVITHGTDTVEETAYFLSRVLKITKPIVFTCAMRPSNAPDADGPANLLFSIQVAQNAVQAGLSGVVLAAGGGIWNARDVEKIHPRNIQAFGYRENPSAPFLCDQDEMKYAFRCTDPCIHLSIKSLFTHDGPWVEVLHSNVGASRKVVSSLVSSGVNGIIVAATGNGTVHHELEIALEQARREGVWVWRTSRCGQGLLEQDSAAKFPSFALSPVKARIEMLLQILAKKERGV
jgi:L-asparaginase